MRTIVFLLHLIGCCAFADAQTDIEYDDERTAIIAKFLQVHLKQP